MDKNIVLLRELEAKTMAHLCVGRLTANIAGFFVALHPTDSLIYFNNAMASEPVEGDLSAAVELLRSHFLSHDRQLRFEILEPLWPGVAERLIAAGMELQGKMPLMLCSPGSLRVPAVPENLTFEYFGAETSRARLMDFLTVGHVVFDQPTERVDDQRLDDWIQRHREGMISAAALDNGEIVAIASISAGNNELVGVGTLASHRRRGISSALSAFLLKPFFEAGNNVAWLSAADLAARTVYEKIGFKLIGHQLDLVDPNTAIAPSSLASNGEVS